MCGPSSPPFHSRSRSNSQTRDTGACTPSQKIQDATERNHPETINLERRLEIKLVLNLNE